MLERAEELQEGATLYIATDEKREFFEVFKHKYDVVFLEDFLNVLTNVNTNLYPMIEQLVCSKSRIFYGTYSSTFSGYINRLRGYHVTKNKLEGYKDGTMVRNFLSVACLIMFRTTIQAKITKYCYDTTIP